MTGSGSNRNLIGQLWNQFGLATVFHKEHGVGQVVRVGIAPSGLVFIDVIFRNGHRDSFDEPFSAVKIETIDENAETPI